MLSYSFLCILTFLVIQEEIAARKKEWELERLRTRLEEEERSGQDSDADDLLTMSRETAMNQVKKSSNTTRRQAQVVNTRDNLRSSPNRNKNTQQVHETQNTRHSTRRTNTPLSSPVKQAPQMNIRSRDSRSRLSKDDSKNRTSRPSSPAKKTPHETRYRGIKQISYDELESDLTEESSQDTVITPAKPVISRSDKKTRTPSVSPTKNPDGSYYTIGRDGKTYRVGLRDSSGKFIKKTSTPAKNSPSPPKRVRINDSTTNGIDSDSSSRKSSRSPVKGTPRSRSSSNSSQRIDDSRIMTTKNNGNVVVKDESETNNVTNGSIDSSDRRLTRQHRR